ncbi:hypothetical protein CFOL_v3_21119 [Cephalotus follicularis]|uniref:Uncharacterized protein n=1 Tax=Cephalotus follicularis TaxID=3775 RepID=A0A1Q3CBZ3_CEPFO|nr:hypothetical protein CFOL_v3_21119 [Cephalotus follicularis]
MSEEEGGGFEEWDADFYDQLIQLEELALSSSNPTQQQQQQQQQQPQPQQQLLISYSPPRELSQRPSSSSTTATHSSVNAVAVSLPSTTTTPFPCPRPGSDNATELEVDRLKRELRRVSKHLTELEQECFELRKERNQEQGKIKVDVDKDAGVLKSTNTSRGHGIPTTYCHGVSQPLKNAKVSKDQVRDQSYIATPSSKTIGVQIDRVGDFIDLSLNDSLPAWLGLSEKLQGIWGSPNHQNLRKNVISRLLVACPTDFHVLFGCMSINTSSKVVLDSLAGESSSNVALQCQIRSFHTLEAAKVSHLYYVLTQIGNGMMRLEALIEPLLDLCNLENERSALYSDSTVTNVAFRGMSSMVNSSSRFGGKPGNSRKLTNDRIILKVRDNIIVEGRCSMNNNEDFQGYEREKNGGLFSVSREEAAFIVHIPFGIYSGAENVCKSGYSNPSSVMSLSCVNWVSLFEFMHQIALRNFEERTRLEAVAIMNLILLRSNAHMREKFGRTHVFESISQLLKREAGLHVQKEAVHLLYLLLNCPKLLVKFCSGCNEVDSESGANDGDSTSKGFTIILEGLADCITCCRNGVQGLELQRNAMILLAFIASSGKSGFEILASHKLSREANFLMLILQVLVSEMDIEAASSTESEEILNARASVIREALILLNRLVSNPAYSATVLRVLTNSRDLAGLTIDIAKSLCRRDQRLGQSDSLPRQMRDSDIVELAQVFKKRVFVYLGDTIS